MCSTRLQCLEVLVRLVRVGVDFLEILLVEILAAREKGLKRASGKAGPARLVDPRARYDWTQIDKIVHDKKSLSILAQLRGACTYPRVPKMNVAAETFRAWSAMNQMPS